MPRVSNLPPGPGPGRPKGLLNKVTLEVRRMTLAALDQAGGAEYLAAQAQEHPKEFLALLTRVAPKRHVVNQSQAHEAITFDQLKNELMKEAA